MKTWLRLIGRFKLEECISFGNGRYNSSSSVLGNFFLFLFFRRVFEIYYSGPYVWFSFYPRKPMTPPLFMLAVFGSAIYHFQSETPFHFALKMYLLRIKIIDERYTSYTRGRFVRMMVEVCYLSRHNKFYAHKNGNNVAIDWCIDILFLFLVYYICCFCMQLDNLFCQL